MIGGNHEHVAQDWNMALNRGPIGLRGAPPLPVDYRGYFSGIQREGHDSTAGDGSGMLPLRTGVLRLTLGQGR